ncbi:hypothetical protein COOONC_17929, partial [Cooperia oncophora]
EVNGEWPNNQIQRSVQYSQIRLANKETSELEQPVRSSSVEKEYLAEEIGGNPRQKNNRSTHFMLTRSKAKLSSSLTIVTIIFTALLSPCSASDVVTSTRCPRTVSVATRIIYGESSMAWKKVSQLQPYGERQQSTTLVLVSYPVSIRTHSYTNSLASKLRILRKQVFLPKMDKELAHPTSGQHKEASQANKVPSSIFYKPPHTAINPTTPILFRTSMNHGICITMSGDKSSVVFQRCFGNDERLVEEASVWMNQLLEISL